MGENNTFKGCGVMSTPSAQNHINKVSKHIVYLEFCKSYTKLIPEIMKYVASLNPRLKNEEIL